MEEIQKIKDNEIYGDNDDLEESIDADIYERFEEKPIISTKRIPQMVRNNIVRKFILHQPDSNPSTNRVRIYFMLEV